MPSSRLHFSNMAKLKLDLHEIYNKGWVIEEELNRVIQEALETKTEEVEIIPGKGTGALMEAVKRFLRRKEIKNLYHRIKVDPKNHGRLFVYFRFKKNGRR